MIRLLALLDMIVFPAQAGVILKSSCCVGNCKSFPRASGGDPMDLGMWGKKYEFSPRKRG